MTDAELRRLYERYPYPSPDPDSRPVHDVAAGIALLLPGADLAGWRVLDAGCGTGHRLVALAQRYPGATFLGVDPVERSLDVARDLAARNGVRNVEFVRGGFPGLPLPFRFDLVVCSGVLHHLADPAAGLAWLADRLGDDGLLYLWLYHALGEHDRMLDRELVRLLGGDLTAVRALGLRLSGTRYGATAGSRAPGEREQDVLDADAYLNPVVRPLRFGDLPGLVAGTSLEWCAAVGVNTEGGGRLLDLGGVEADRTAHVAAEDLVPGPLRDRVARLSNLHRAELVELSLRPTGFSAVAGRGAVPAGCAGRIRHNVLVP